jgi:hypothetical protein
MSKSSDTLKNDSNAISGQIVSANVSNVDHANSVERTTIPSFSHIIFLHVSGSVLNLTPY